VKYHICLTPHRRLTHLHYSWKETLQLVLSLRRFVPVAVHQHITFNETLGSVQDLPSCESINEQHV
jgi:hypothetical protein